MLSITLIGLTGSASAQTGAHANQGVLRGKIVMQGGSPTTGTPAALAGTVAVYTRTGKPIARQHVRAGHDFRFRLAPGRYLLNVGPKLRYKPAVACPPTPARVRSGTTTTVIVGIGCGIP